jgi:hypothetical protein
MIRRTGRPVAYSVPVRSLYVALSTVVLASTIAGCDGSRRSRAARDDEETSAPRQVFLLKDVQGNVIGANSGPELRNALDEIYQGRILAEASTLGEREPESR